jgi:hypothetical protein
LTSGGQGEDMHPLTLPAPLIARPTPGEGSVIRTTDGAGPDRRWPFWSFGSVAALATLATLVTGISVLVAARTTSPDDVALAIDVVLADSGMTIAELVRIVGDAAEATGADRPLDELTVILTDEVPSEDGRFLGGLQVGTTVWVRIDGLALPSRTLLHEAAHAFTPGDGHGERFREVYLTAMTEVYGRASATREARRLAWVYDRCYRDDTCPALDRGRPVSGRPRGPRARARRPDGGART